MLYLQITKITFSRTEPEGKLILGYRKASRGPKSDQGTQAAKSGNEMHAGGDIGNQKPKLKENLNKYCSKVKYTTGGSSSIPFERKNVTLNSKRKRSKVDNTENLGLKITLEEAQGLFRSPLNHAPHVIVIEDFKFEEYEEAPVIGRPTIIVRDSLGEDIQWAQCDNCLKWRKLPLDYLLPARWTCTENDWNPERSSCEAAQELTVKQLKNLLSINRPAASKKLQDAELDAYAYAFEDLEALENFSYGGYSEVSPASTTPTTKHPRHRDGCSCIVCSQPPSGGPKHQQNCTCKVCLSVRRRLQTMMIRREGNQSGRGSVVQECKPQGNTHLSKKSDPFVELLGSSSQGCVNEADKNLTSVSIKDQIDLNTWPKLGEEASTCCNSMNLIKTMQDAQERDVCKFGSNIDTIDVGHGNCDNSSTVEYPPVSDFR